MKKILVVACVILSGCSTGVLRYDAKKTGTVTVDNVQNIVRYYKSSGINKNTILQNFKLYPSAKLKTIYKIGFPFSFSESAQDSQGATYHKRIENISIGLCSQRRNGSIYFAFGKNGYYIVYTSLEELIAKGLVEKQKQKQKEICIYRDYTAPTHAAPMGHFEVKSNRVKYEIDEINSAVSLFKKLQGK